MIQFELKRLCQSIMGGILICGSVAVQAQPTPILGHAHNDYNHERPLLDALEKGYTSIEVDVFPIEGKLYVAHDLPQDLSQYATIEEMYLQPLKDYIKSHGGKLYSDDAKKLILMVDIKRDGPEAYRILRELLVDYRDIIWHKEHGTYTDGPVRVILSGNRPYDLVLQDEEMYIGLDGRPDDLGKGYSSLVMPVISQNFRIALQWNGQDRLSRHDFLPVHNMTEQAHAEGKIVRLWASPEDESVWNLQLEAGVDLINTDQLERLKKYFDQR